MTALLVFGVWAWANPAPEADTVLARVPGHRITEDDYRRYLAASGLEQDPDRIEQDLAFLAVTEVLLENLDLLPEGVADVIADNAENRVLAATLKQYISKRIVVPEKKLREAFFGNPDNLHKPKKFRLYEIFLKYPDPADDSGKRAVVDRLKEIRKEAVGGGDFSRLAKRYSQSQTRLGGGYVGVVAAEDLPAALGEAVSRLAEGEMTPVLAGKEGAVLLRCDLVIPEKSKSFEEMKETVRKIMHRRYFRRRWDEMTDRMLAEAAPEISCETLKDPPDPKVRITRPVRWKSGDFSRSEALALLAGAGINPEEESCRRIEDFFRTVITNLKAAGRARDLALDQAIGPKIFWARRKALAGAVLTRMVEQRLRAPGEQEITEEIRSHPAHYRLPRSFLLSVILIDGGKEDLSDRWKRAEKLIREMDGGKMDFAGIAREFSAHPSAKDGGRLDWRTPAGMFEFGADSFRIISAMKPGETSGPVQDGTKLWIFRLEGVREARPMPKEQARNRAKKRLTDARRRDLEEKIHAESLVSLEIVRSNGEK